MSNVVKLSLIKGLIIITITQIWLMLCSLTWGWLLWGVRRGGSSAKITAWCWSDLWEDCDEDSSAVVKHVDFGVLWTVKRGDLIAHLISGCIWMSFGPTCLLSVISSNPSCQGALDGQSGPQPGGRHAHVLRFRAHTCRWGSEMQGQPASGSQRHPSALQWLVSGFFPRIYKK